MYTGFTTNCTIYVSVDCKVYIRVHFTLYISVECTKQCIVLVNDFFLIINSYFYKILLIRHLSLKLSLKDYARLSEILFFNEFSSNSISGK